MLKRITRRQPRIGPARTHARAEIGNREAGSVARPTRRSLRPTRLPSAISKSQIDSLLRSHGQNDLWQLAADLAHRNVKPEALESLFATLDAETARAALVRIAASLEVASLLNEIESGTSRISDLVRAIKEYTYMDQTPVQNVDIVKSLETTLTIMNHKLKHGVVVKRDYETHSSSGEFVRQRAESGVDQPHRQRHRRHGRQGRASRSNLSRGRLRGGRDRRQRPGNSAPT